MQKNAVAIFAFSLMVTLGCGPNPEYGQDDVPPNTDEPSAASNNLPRVGGNPENRPGVHNLMRLTDEIYSGSEPHGEQGFAQLEELGIRTVVSVDGEKPNVELARKHGIRYVHIPIGYDGVPKESGLAFARLAKEFDGPVYVHCHHGKHRGPAAAAVVCIAAGEVEAKDAAQILERAGTSKGYQGLWRDVENYTPPPPDAKLPELVEVAEVSSFATAMSQVDRSYDNLTLCRDAKWSVPPVHPDLDPTQEALLVQEGLHEAGRILSEDSSPQLRDWLAEAEQQAKELHTVLKEGDLAAAGARLSVLEQSCKHCHNKYRDQ